MGRRDRPTGPAGPPQRCQVRRARRPPGRPRGARTRAPAQPRRRGDREAIRVLLATREGAVLIRTRAIAHPHGLVVNAPEGIRNQLRKLTTDELLARCARLRTGPSQSVEHRSTITALRSTARRASAS